MKMSTVLYVKGISQERDHHVITAASMASSVALVSSKRLYKTVLKSVPGIQLPPHIPIAPLRESILEIRKALKRGDVTVLASGDPLFYGIGRRLKKEFPDQEINFQAALSSMQVCFARFGIPWDDASIVSLHGRTSASVLAKLLNSPKVFVFTDHNNCPDAIARKILREAGDKASGDTQVFVAENLGDSKERLFSGILTETAAEDFAEPNVMILLNSQAKPNLDFSLGLEESEICHSRGLITKNEVRATVIHALRLPCSGVLWDVGAGSGSIGIEASRLAPELQVLSIEKESEQWQNITLNRQHFRAWNMTLIQGAAPEALLGLPAPSRVFIGGSGGNLQEILEFCVKRLLPGGIIVVNAVISKTAKLAPVVLHRLGIRVEIKEIAVTRYKYPPEEKQKFNPITIIVGKKEKQESLVD